MEPGRFGTFVAAFLSLPPARCLGFSVADSASQTPLREGMRRPVYQRVRLGQEPGAGAELRLLQETPSRAPLMLQHTANWQRGNDVLILLV